jgi:hypothetical protein
MQLCAVPDVEHMHGVTLDGEEDTVHVVARAVEELPYFLRKMLVLRSQWTTRGKLSQGIDGLDNPRKPLRCSLGCVVAFPQIRRLDFRFGLQLGSVPITCESHFRSLPHYHSDWGGTRKLSNSSIVQTCSVSPAAMAGVTDFHFL